ncbi:PEP-CTERM sorting domain-containing protein [Rhodoferax sp. AJA081-3]|uniref:PEP-CTERM sorting domain-containing protein n=1 Tax=Rhodoferax sp. AJA081-3 TaxID=2752316 RepID=UPI001BB7CBA2|nr:PEP-CTERM sorting domain-containing protein [Rhodoferax sp. AJA081-3]QTN26838.1 PEP-CTERM sorting domain-containing protein [Rhodoferax sp. AJA081-3]
MSIKNIVACAAIAACSFAAQAQNIVVNGSFEQVSGNNTQNAGSWGIYTSINGWTGTPNIEVRDSIAGNAQQGSNYVELDTTGNSGMFQTVTGNGWYELSFWYSARQGVAAGSNGLSFTFGNLSGQVLANVAGAPSGNVWQQYTGLVFLNGATNLTFSATGGSDSLGGSLDNVSVTTAVPEPESYAMMLAGLALMGTIARRRKSKSA